MFMIIPRGSQRFRIKRNERFLIRTRFIAGFDEYNILDFAGAELDACFRCSVHMQYYGFRNDRSNTRVRLEKDEKKINERIARVFNIAICRPTTMKPAVLFSPGRKSFKKKKNFEKTRNAAEDRNTANFGDHDPSAAIQINIPIRC